jgi:putative oxidoreductase
VTSGGAELPLAYLSQATALMLAGSGRYSLDKALGIKVPTAIVALTAAGVAAGVAAGFLTREQRAEPQEQETPPIEEQPSLAKDEPGADQHLMARDVGSD